MTVFSNNIKINGVVLNSKEPQYSNQSWTGQRIIRSTGIQYYEFDFNLTFNIQNKGEVLNFLAQYSQGKPFQLSLGHWGEYYGTQSGSIVVNQSANKGSNTIQCTNNTLEVGTLVQFFNHKKIYRIIDKVNNTLTIFPSLRQNVQVQEQVYYDNLIIEAVLNPDNDYSIGIDTITTLQLKSMEYLQ